jgi:hypothetical protein
MVVSFLSIGFDESDRTIRQKWQGVGLEAVEGKGEGESRHAYSRLNIPPIFKAV